MRLGIDIGSTTIKYVVLDDAGRCIDQDYQRHSCQITEKLIEVLQQLVEAGNTVLVIEHNLDVIAEADWIIDMGPEGGSQGGKNVFAGPPQRLLRASTHTAEALKEFMETAKLKKTQSA